MPIMLDPQLEAEINQRAQIKGFSDPADYIRELLRKDGDTTPGDRLVAHLRGRLKGGPSTDEIMAMTRGDD